MGGDDKLRRKAERSRATTMERHVLVCVGGDCGGNEIAKRLRKAIAREGLRSTVSVAKVDCFDICTKGTIAVVYPEGAWYARLDAKAVDRVVREHLRDGHLVEDLLFLHNPLQRPPDPA